MMSNATHKNDLPAGEQSQVISNTTANICDKLTFAKMYAKHNFTIFPCKVNSKTPAISKWQEAATNELATIEAWWAQNPDYNIGVVADEHIVLDVDIKPDGSVDGFASLDKHPTLPETFTVNTPSGGKHYYFATDDASLLRLRQGFEPGLDIRAGGKGYSIGAGSSIDGVSYEAGADSVELVDAPDWVLAAALKKSPAASKLKLHVTSQDVSPVSVPLSEIATVLSYIDPDVGYEKWINIGMAIHSEYPCMKGLELWDNWSSDGHTYQPNECAMHWNGFDAGNGITISTLFYHAPEYLIAKAGYIDIQSTHGENDTTLAEFFVDQYRSTVIYESTSKHWLVFNDGEWVKAQDAKRLVLERYKEVVIEIKRQIQAGVDVPMSMKWLNKAMNHANQNSVLKIVETYLSVGAGKLDANSNLIGLGKDVYEISTHTLRPAQGEDLVTKSLGTHYDKAATCPVWERFILTAMESDQDMVGYLQRLVGYFLTTSITEQQLFFFYGSGANGKSTFLDSVKAMLGDYAVKINSDTIMKGKVGGRSNAVLAGIADLAGARLGITDEMDDNSAAFDTQTLKSLSGDEELNAKRLYRNPFTFKSTAKIVMYGNDKPYGNINDEGFWRRMRFIHFGYVVPKEQRDPNLLNTLKSEMPGILNWALAGLVQWEKQGLNAPDKVTHNSDEYKKELDSITEYFDDNVQLQAESVTTSKTLYEGYIRWCEENLLIPEPKHSFSRKCAVYFKQYQTVTPYKNSRSRGYKGITLKV